jgi:hypothetical protein
MRLNLTKYVATLTVDPQDQYNTENLLGECPDDERHRLLKSKADILRDNLYEPKEAIEMLRKWLNRQEKGNEIADTVRRSYEEIDEVSIISSAQKKKTPPLNVQKVVTLWKQYGGYADLLEDLGYVRNPEISDTLTEDWLSWLYKPDDLLCVGKNKFDMRVEPLSTYLRYFDMLRGDIARHPLLCKFLIAQTGAPYYCLMTPATYRERWVVHNRKNSGRCDPNVLTRKYFVVECDISPAVQAWRAVLPHPRYDGFDLQSGVIRHLFELGYPIVSIVHSGNKSLHVWCSGQGITEEEINEKIAYTAALGADAKAGMSRSQLMRIVNPTHPQRPQHLLYFDANFINHE